MTPTEWTTAAIVAWFVLMIAAAFALGRFLQACDDVEPVERMTELPPVPQSWRRGHFTDDPSASWLADQPAEVAAVDELDRRFFSIVDRERWFV